jgi:hypothetical protein
MRFAMSIVMNSVGAFVGKADFGNMRMGDVDHSPNSACPMDMTLLLSGSKILIWRHHQ